MARAIDDPIRAGREALERHAWQEAFELLTEADQTSGLSAEDLASLGDAAWWAGHMDAAVTARERAYAAFVQDGEPARAAMLAVLVARDHAGRLERSLASAWLSRAERILEQEPESAAHGWLARTRASRHFDAAEWEQGLSLAQEALDIGTRLGDRDLQALGVHSVGIGLAGIGRVDEGRALQDEATVAAVSGELSPFVTGLIYCNVIQSCADLGDYGRAGEWTEAAKRWCERQSITGFPGVCRIHRAEIMRLRGSWTDAVDEVQRACAELEGHGLLALAGEAFNELGHIRLRMGELDAAADAFRQSNELGHEPQPGLAMLRLAEGKLDEARTGVERAMAEVGEDRLRLVKLLPVRVRIALLEGDVEAARAATETIEAIAAAYGTTAFQAMALSCRGAVETAEGRSREALDTLRRARAMWSEIDLPYEGAETRVLLGLAYRAAGDAQAATLELEGARAAFERLGAVLDARRVGESLGAASLPTREERAFMFTDIVKSTDLVAAIGDDAWTDLVAWHDRTLRACFTEGGGEVVDEAGDGYFVAFPSAAEALACGVQIQRKLAEHRREAGFAPQVRIGVHVAEASKVGPNYRGRGVHEAARIGGVAGGGEIVATASTLEAAGGGFPAGEPRAVDLKGFAEPVEVVSVDWR